MLLSAALLMGCGGAGLSDGASARPGGSPTPTPFQPSIPTKLPEGAISTTSPSAVATRVAASLALRRFTFSRPQLMPAVTEILVRVNRERAARDLPELDADSGLTELAFQRCEDMTAREFLDHTDPDSGDNLAWNLLTAAGFEGKVAENLYATTAGLEAVPEEVISAWMASPDHRSPILDRQFRLTGAGLMGDGTWWRVCELFAEGGS